MFNLYLFMKQSSWNFDKQYPLNEFNLQATRKYGYGINKHNYSNLYGNDDLVAKKHNVKETTFQDCD